jgi:methylglutaconyl-CoA hydratase
MYTSGGLIAELDSSGVLRVVFSRPDASNAFDGEMLVRFDQLLDTCGTEPDIRVLYLSSIGRNFCSGVDLKWLAARRASTTQQPVPKLDELLTKLHRLPVPIVTRVQGAAVGAGAAIVACSDLVVAASDAYFLIPEVRLGIPPLSLLPYFTAAMGARWTARYVMTGERLPAEQAVTLGLVHQTGDLEETAGLAEGLVAALLRGGPGALRSVKSTIGVLGRSPTEGLERSEGVAETPEAKEGIAAFLEKRHPSWYRAPV